MSVLNKLDGVKRKAGLLTTDELKEKVRRRLEEDWIVCAKMCIARPDAYKQKIAAILCVREEIGANLITAKRWVERYFSFPQKFSV